MPVKPTRHPWVQGAGGKSSDRIGSDSKISHPLHHIPAAVGLPKKRREEKIRRLLSRVLCDLCGCTAGLKVSLVFHS